VGGAQPTLGAGSEQGADLAPQEARDCSALCAQSVNGEYMENTMFAWDERHCGALYSGCAGADCDALFASGVECYAVWGPCDPLLAERASCIAQHPATAADIEATLAAVGCSTLPNGCGAGHMISRSAAECIARLEGLPAGVAAWSVNATYHDGHNRVIWNVSSTVQSSADGASGVVMSLDGNTGYLLDTLGWSVIPGRPFLVEGEARTARAVERADYQTLVILPQQRKLQLAVTVIEEVVWPCLSRLAGKHAPSAAVSEALSSAQAV
jgi:hypothetical protein